jgi:cell division protein FtsQ
VQKITGRAHSAGLLEPEQPPDFARPHTHAETTVIPDPLLEETADREEREPFLRARQRVPVRRRGGGRFARRFSSQSPWIRVAAILAAFVVLGLVAYAAWRTKSLMLQDPHFRLNSAQDIQITGNRVVSNAQILAIFTPDLGLSILRVPLVRRQAQLDQVRWVRRASVMRLWPNRMRVNIVERTPIAFARAGNSIRLVDDEGVLLDLPNATAQNYSFPILNGLSDTEAPAARAAQVDLYRRFVQALDADGGGISSTLSEVDLSDPEDVRAMFTGSAHQPMVHFGTSNFLPRYQAYRTHLAEWLQQYPQLRSVDMRYGRQVVLDTGVNPEALPSSQRQLTLPLAPRPSSEKQSLQSQHDGVSEGQRNSLTSPSPTGLIATQKPAIPVSSKAGRKNSSSAKTATTKSKKKTMLAKKSVHAKRHAPVQNKGHKHTPGTGPERGHPVRNPIMHVVSGA